MQEVINILVKVEIDYEKGYRKEAIKQALGNVKACKTYGGFASAKAIDSKYIPNNK